MAINFEQRVTHVRYTDDHGNVLGKAHYNEAASMFELIVNPDFADGIGMNFTYQRAHSLEPLGTICLAIRQMATAAGY